MARQLLSQKNVGANWAPKEKGLKWAAKGGPEHVIAILIGELEATPKTARRG
jgi:hypothetical protein